MKEQDFTIDDIIGNPEVRDVLNQINDKSSHIDGIIAIVQDGDDGCITYYSTVGDLDKVIGILERFKHTLLQGDDRE